MAPQAPRDALSRAIATTMDAHAAAGLPGVSWAAEYIELERLMRAHPNYAAYVAVKIGIANPKVSTSAACRGTVSTTVETRRRMEEGCG